jgi:lipopolysaccharide export LptBFGC system permease protein LptF
MAALLYQGASTTMRISDRYIGKQVLFGTLFAVLVLSLVLVLGNLFKEIRPLLVDKQAPLWLVLRFMFNALLVSLMFSVPWGFLSSVLLTFGRMSSAQELTGFRVAGVSLARLVLPVMVIATLLSAGCLWLNVRVVPQAKAPVRELIYEQVKRDPRALLSPGIANADFRNVKFFIEEQQGDSMMGLHLYKVDPAAKVDPAKMEIAPPEIALHAGRFTFVVDEDRKELRLKLYDANFLTRSKSGDGPPEHDAQADANAPANPLDGMEPGANNKFEIFSAEEAEPYLLPFGDLFHKRAKPSAMTNTEIRNYLASRPELTEDQRVPFEVEIIQRYSFSMACLAFAFVGVPLGMQGRRKDSSRGLLLSLVLAGVYFLFSVLADETGNVNRAMIVLWAPNVLCVLVGLWLFKRAKFK